VKKLKAALTAVEDKLGLNERLLKKARRRHKTFRVRAEVEHKAQIEHQEHATRLRAEGGQNAAEASIVERKAARCQHRAERSHNKSVYWKGRIKQQVARVHHLERSEAEIKAELRKWKKEHGVLIHGSKVMGGTARQRLKAALLRAMLNYRNGSLAGYYSQTGGPRDYLHAIYHYALERIWDCSTFADGVYLCCGLEAPSGPNTLTAGGFTGTEGEHGKRVPESQAQVGDLVLYGPVPHHHVEVVLDPARKTTVGHGSPPIDEGVFDLFGDDDYEIRSYL
jgi:hypothetical protein